MDTRPGRKWLSGKLVLSLIALLVVAAAAIAAADRWLPMVRQLAQATWDGIGHHRPAAKCSCDDHDHDHQRRDHKEAAKGDHGHDEHEGDGHDHAAPSPKARAVASHEGEDEHDHAGGQPDECDHDHDEAAAVRLSRTAEENVGLRLAKVELRDFERTITVPGMVIERPGRSHFQVSAPLTGMVTRIWPMQGETVAPGQPLFDLRLMHEEVVEAQGEFLRVAEELDVAQKQIARLEAISVDGALPAKTVLDRKYEQQKLQGVQRSLRQRLLLHGLTESQIDKILETRTLLSSLTVTAPGDSDGSATPSTARILQVEELTVEKGQHVNAGDEMCVLADYAELFLQGKGFEQDMPALNQAAQHDWPVTAVIAAAEHDRQTVPGLKILYLANKIDPESRALLFYVGLPNKLVRDWQTPDGRRYCGWQFKPGQRVELLVPVERWSGRIVAPASAVVHDGAEWFVFEQNADHFDRRSVRIEYRDQYSAVIANDGTLKPGKMIIVSGAYQVHLAMKNKAGGAPDPHAGHNH